MLCGCRAWPLVLVGVLLQWVQPSCARSGGVGKMRGEYGFLSEFHGIGEEEARRRVRRMALLFGIKEFEFYNAFEGYSKPPGSSKESWRCVCFDTPVSRAILRAYIEEIAALGGRSWLGVVAMGTDPGDADAQEGSELLGQQYVRGRVLLDVVRPTARLAERMAPAWADFASELGFAGIHWATVNEYSKDDDAHHVQEFLQGAAPALQARGLEQTWNFVDGFGWEPALVDEEVVAFPVWEVLDGAVDALDDIRSGIVKRFPSVVTDGQSGKPIKFIERQWAKARCGGLSYLAIGDGSRALRNDYYPGARELNEAEIDDVRRHVFTELVCNGKQSFEGGELTMHVEGLGAQDLQGRRDALGTVLADVYGYGSCRVAEVGEAARPASEKLRVLTPRTGAESSELVISFHGECTSACPSHDSVTVERLREAVESALEAWQNGEPVRVHSAQVRWPGETAGGGGRAPEEAGWPRAAIWAVPVVAAACCCLLAQRVDIARRAKAALGSRELDGYTCDSPSMKLTGGQAPVRVLSSAPLSEADVQGTPAAVLDPVHARLLTEKTTIV